MGSCRFRVIIFKSLESSATGLSTVAVNTFSWLHLPGSFVCVEESTCKCWCHSCTTETSLLLLSSLLHGIFLNDCPKAEIGLGQTNAHAKHKQVQHFLNVVTQDHRLGRNWFFCLDLLRSFSSTTASIYASVLTTRSQLSRVGMLLVPYTASEMGQITFCTYVLMT